MISSSLSSIFYSDPYIDTNFTICFASIWGSESVPMNSRSRSSSDDCCSTLNLIKRCSLLKMAPYWNWSLHKVIIWAFFVAISIICSSMQSWFWSWFSTENTESILFWLFTPQDSLYTLFIYQKNSLDSSLRVSIKPNEFGNFSRQLSIRWSVCKFWRSDILGERLTSLFLERFSTSRRINPYRVSGIRFKLFCSRFNIRRFFISWNISSGKSSILFFDKFSYLRVFGSVWPSIYGGIWHILFS